MSSSNFVILYVDSPLASAEFYTTLLARQPLETSPTFAMFRLDSGLMLGLWSRHTVEPAASALVSGGELAFVLERPEAVTECYQQWQALGLTVLQPPLQMDFGFTFVVQDPDGHRLRVFCPGDE